MGQGNEHVTAREFTTAVERIENRFDRLEVRFDRLDQKLDNHGERIVALETSDKLRTRKTATWTAVVTTGAVAPLEGVRRFFSG